MNKVYEIIHDKRNGEIAFIVRTDDEDQYWWYVLVREDIVRYFGTDNITIEQADIFVNDPQNDTLGVSCGDFETIEDAVKDFWGI